MSEGMRYHASRHNHTHAQSLLYLCFAVVAIASSNCQTGPQVSVPQSGPAATGSDRAAVPATDLGQTVKVNITVQLRPGAIFDSTDGLEAALAKAGCRKAKTTVFLNATAVPGCTDTFRQVLPGRRRRYLQADPDPSADELCRRIGVQAMLITPNPGKCARKLLMSQENGRFQARAVEAGFERGIIESASVVDAASATTMKGAPGASSCSFNGSIGMKFGVREAVQCDTCACISDPMGSNCSDVASKICISEKATATCTTLQSGLLSGVLEEMAAAASAIATRCPTLDVGRADVCSCLEDFGSVDCSAVLFRSCVQYPSLCMGRVQALVSDAPMAVLDHLRDLAGVCREEQNLLVRSIVILGTSRETLPDEELDRFRNEVAALAGVEASNVTILDIQTTGSSLNVTFAVYTRDPVTAEENIVKADAIGTFSAQYGDASIQGVVAVPAPPMEDPGRSFSKIRGWQIFLVFLGVLGIIAMLLFAAHSNRVFVQKSGLSSSPPDTPDAMPTWQDKNRNEEMPSMEEGGIGRGTDGGMIRSYSSSLATGSARSLKWQPGGRPALELDSRSGEEKRQWRTIHMPAPFIRDSSSDDSSASDEDCDSFSDRTPNAAPAAKTRKAAPAAPGPHRPRDRGRPPSPDADAHGKGFPDLRLRLGSGLGATGRLSTEGAKSPLMSETSMTEYLSADELEASQGDDATSRASDASSASCPVAVSMNCPPSPYSPWSPAQGPRTPSRTPQSQQAPSSLISSSDLEFDVDMEEKGVSQFQYQGFPPEADAEVYSKQYVNYLFDAPLSSRSQATNRSGLSEFAGGRMRD